MTGPTWSEIISSSVSSCRQWWELPRRTMCVYLYLCKYVYNYVYVHMGSVCVCVYICIHMCVRAMYTCLGTHMCVVCAYVYVCFSVCGCGMCVYMRTCVSVDCWDHFLLLGHQGKIQRDNCVPSRPSILEPPWAVRWVTFYPFVSLRDCQVYKI